MFLSLHYHIVFSRRHREPSIEPAWRSRLHEYFGGTVNGPGGFAQAVGGGADHRSSPCEGTRRLSEAGGRRV
jgi:putative transposase